MRFRDLNDKDKKTVKEMFEKMGEPVEDEDKIVGFFCTRKDMNRLPEQEPPKPETLKEKLKRISKPKLIENE